MPARFPGTAYGPGFSTKGTAVEFDVTDYGLSLVTVEEHDGAPPWTEVDVKRQGFNDAQLLLQWPGKAGRYALGVAGDAAIAAVTAACAKNAPVQTRHPDRVTRAWVQGMLWVTVLLPLLLLAGLVWQHERIAQWAVDRVPVAQEREVGKLLFDQTRSRLKIVEGQSADMVREIGARLTRGSAYQYEFYVAEDKSVNAFAMPGGYVVVHTGLLALAATPEEVAGVLAHEVRHVEGRHSLRALVKNAGISVTLTLIFGDIRGLAGMANQLLDLKFSRDNEAEADHEGLKSLVTAGIRPQGMRDFFRKMAAQDSAAPAWLSSHPASNERYASLDAAIVQLAPAALQAPPLPYDYAAIKATLPKAALPAPPEKK